MFDLRYEKPHTLFIMERFLTCKKYLFTFIVRFHKRFILIVYISSLDRLFVTKWQFELLLSGAARKAHDEKPKIGGNKIRFK